MAPTGTSDQKPGLRAQQDSIRLPFSEIVTWLRANLGVRMVAYIAGETSTQPVSAWADGVAEPGAAEQERLRYAFHAAAILRERHGIATTQSWFMGTNPKLVDEAPARVLRTEDVRAGAREVIVAAQGFARE